jgi:hypothetical protein
MMFETQELLINKDLCGKLQKLLNFNEADFAEWVELLLIKKLQYLQNDGVTPIKII